MAHTPTPWLIRCANPQYNKSCSLPPDTKEDDLQSETWRRTNDAAWDMVTNYTLNNLENKHE